MDIPPIIEAKTRAIPILPTIDLNLLACVFEVLIVTYTYPQNLDSPLRWTISPLCE
jgi:hypothetical protein